MIMDEDSIKERQENEFQVLQSMFVDDMKDLRQNNAWKIWRPLELYITLKPQQSMTVYKEINVQVDLYVHCSPNYPNEIPKLELKNTKGLSTQNIADLCQQLTQLAERLKGEVMIYELAQHVQHFLHQHNKPQFKSFYEEMLHNQKCVEEKEAEALKKQEEIRKLREHQAIQQEIHRKQEALKKVARRRRDSQRQISTSDESDKEDKHNQFKFDDEKAGCNHDEKQLNSAQKRLQSVKKSYGEKLDERKEYKQGEHDSNHILLHLFTKEISEYSRLHKEFEILQWLGSGGFGDVLQAKNKLDGRIYAIKRIHLNPSNKQLNRKIMREVKLLSSLNHENVVRYYHSWIETTTESLKETKESDSSNTAVSESDSSNIKGITSIYSSIEKQAPPLVEGSVEWSVSYDCSAHIQDIASDESSDNDVFGMSILNFSDSSDSILFEDGKEENSRKEDDSLSTQASESQADNSIEIQTLQFMYIQMEFCEKSTLRTAIDENLYSESQRLWRLFREIIEGLCHIHQQGMIHRDLKPVNIFLDSNDHVKIGDFGLATTDILPKSMECDGRNLDPNELSCFELIENYSKTGAVGTALYVAPELITKSSSKVPYNQKVDLYSLGIIFFEMCYPKLRTGMERVKILVNLRLPDICFPSDVHEHLSAQQIYLIKWLLQHDVTKRPTSYELLASDYMPPPQMEETELNEMLRHIVSNPQSKAYKRMISTLFKQETTVAADVTYDMDLQKVPPLNQSALAFTSCVQSLEKIMQRHGAIMMSTPTLMPKSSIYETSDWCVRVMNHCGGIVMLPHDLRVPFARFVARREITNFKRYTLGKVYRERKVFGFHPRELYECAFDIVTSNIGRTLLPDTEVLKVVSEIVSEIPALQTRAYTIHLNHASLLKAVLLHCGVPEEKFHAVYTILIDSKKEEMSKSHAQNKLISLGLSDQSVTSLCHYTEIQEPITKIERSLWPIIKRKNNLASSLAKQGLHDLKLIVANSQALAVKNPVLITPGLVYSINLFSGMMFDFTCELKKKHQKRCVDVLAAGGRYDDLVASFSSSTGVREVNQSAVGVSIAVEKIVAALAESEEFQVPGGVDVLVCSTGNKSMVKEKCTILQELWGCGIHADVTYDTSQSLEDITEFCQEHKIPYIVILKDTECGVCGVRILEKERFSEKKIPLTELLDFLQKLTSTKGDQNENQKFEVSRSNSYCEYVSSSGPCINITFLPKEKITLNNKKRCEIQIMSQLSAVLQSISSRVKVEILGVELPAAVIKTVVANLELENESAFEASISAIIEKHPREKRLLIRLMDQIHEQRFEKKCPVLVLYSLLDNCHKIIM